MKIKLIHCFIVFLLIILGGFEFAKAAPPIKDASYSGKYVSQSIADPISIGAGQTQTVTVKIKNTGAKIWPAAGAGYVSVYTVNPNYHDSIFFDKSTWISTDHPAQIARTTLPGATAEIKIVLRAPAKLGAYKEEFYLVAEDATWIKGSGFYFKINVVQSAQAAAAPADDESDSNTIEDESTKANADYAVSKLAATLNAVTTTGGASINFVIRYNNSGRLDWKSYSWQEAGSRRTDDGGSAVNIADQSWVNSRKILEVGDAVKSGESFSTNFVFRAPAKTGQYILRFQLMADGHTLNGGIYELPVVVTADAPAGYESAVFASARAPIDEPIIRVGLYKSSEPVEFLSGYAYSVYFGASTQSSLDAVAQAQLSYKKGVYSISANGVTVTSTDYIRLVPAHLGNYFILSDYGRYYKSLSKASFNAYRGVLAYRYSPKSALPYVINELPLDYYIAGIAETSNGAAMEYIKAILTAARSYAFAQIAAISDTRLFDVLPTTADQLYLGYNAEQLLPRVVQAQENTYGEMVTYNANPVVTPYFGRSNGHTKTWKEVWGGADKPWLQKVECAYDKGKTLWGHGVGMSAQDAAKRADKDGWTHDRLLRYYYTGVEVEKIY